MIMGRPSVLPSSGSCLSEPSWFSSLLVPLRYSLGILLGRATPLKVSGNETSLGSQNVHVCPEWLTPHQELRD